MKWTSTPLGRLYRVRDQRAGSLATSLPLMAVSQYLGVVPRAGLMGDAGRADDFTSYKLCFPGDVVLNRMSAYKGALGVARECGLVSPDYLVMEPTGPATAEFLARWLKTPFGVSEMTQRLRGIGGPDAAQVRTPRINHKDLRSILVSLPSLLDQRAIADYLDRETAQIDELIGKQEQLIETLRERRAAVVENMTARNGDEPGVLKLGRAFSLHNGDRGGAYPSREDFTLDGIPFINAGHLAAGAIDFASMNFISEGQFAAMGGAKLRSGDVLFCLRGSLGKFGVFTGKEAPTGALASSLVALRLRDARVNLRYFTFLLSTQRTADMISLAQTGSAQPNLSAEQVAQFAFPLPPVDEQRSVAAYLDEQTTKIDALIDKAERLIELAKERRSALITAAVTGQIDVRTTSTSTSTSVGDGV